MISITIDSSGVKKAIANLEKSLNRTDTVGRILQYASSVIWIPLVLSRLDNRTGKSNYREELDRTMFDLDSEFANKFRQNDRFNLTEAQRRTESGYVEGEITESIKSAIKPSQPIKGYGYIAVGIGDIDLLNQLAGPIGRNSAYSIWEILQWGTGVYNPKNGSPVIRNGVQVFFNRNIGKGVIVKKTTNPGFKGREYFVQLDGDIHKADYSVMQYVVGYMKKQVEKYSYK